MSRYLEICQGGSNEFEIKDIGGYVKWKGLSEEDGPFDGFAELLHDSYSKDKKSLLVHVGYPLTPGRWDTSINHFNPGDDNPDDGVLEFWSGLSLFTKDPIELLQTDEEWPDLTKVFGHDTDEGMYRLWAFEGKVVVQSLGFKVVKTETYKAKDLLDEELLAEIRNPTKLYCGNCKIELNVLKFDFRTRGYYTEVKAKSGYAMLCQKCYDEYKKPFAEIRKLQDEIAEKQKVIDAIKVK